MEINYEFVPEFKSYEKKFKSDIVSYAGKLLEITSCRSLVVYLDNFDVPHVLGCEDRLKDPSDIELDTY